MESSLSTVSGYLAHLPAILQNGPFLGRFLLAFEAILSGGIKAPEGYAGVMPRGLEEILDDVATNFMPEETPELFLPWLAQWVARSISEDWSTATTRAMLSNAVPLYKQRGTLKGIQGVLDVCMGANVTTVEEALEDARPHYFEVTLKITERDPAALAKKARQVRSIVDQEKPAHTYYSLTIQYPGLRISRDPNLVGGYGPGVRVGDTTVLGTVTATSSSIKSGQ